MDAHMLLSELRLGMESGSCDRFLDLLGAQTPQVKKEFFQLCGNAIDWISLLRSHQSQPA